MTIPHVELPRVIDPRLRIRERAHEALDEVFDMYERGDPLWIVTNQGWTTPKYTDRLTIMIRPESQ